MLGLEIINFFILLFRVFENKSLKYDEGFIFQAINTKIRSIGGWG